MKKIIQAVKGTREFYPPEMALRNWLYQQIREVSLSFGYQEYEAPFLESIELYAAKSGEELVKEQAFVFPDRGGNLITLRPELTPSLARMITQRQNQLTYPLRWWSFGPFWRYERPQKGRTREFFQWNIDLIGVNTPEADAELVCICAELFKKVGLSPDQVKILVNDRQLMEDSLKSVGISKEMKPFVFRLIDRKDKMKMPQWREYGLNGSISEAQLKEILLILENKELYKKSENLMRFFDAVSSLGVKDYILYEPGIIRGLDYYTGIVFEAKDIGEKGRAILGGGHYDNLVEDVGGNQLPGVGFAMGDVVFSLVLEKYGKIPSLLKPPASIMVAVFNQEHINDSIEMSARLRNKGFNVICYPQEEKLSKQFKYADKLDIKIAIIIGPDEKRNKMVSIKDLRTGEQKSVSLESIAEELKMLLSGQ